jgi:hypothetical protein
MRADARSNRVWKRLLQCYGARFTESYGEAPTEPWIVAIDDLSDEQIAYGIRQVMRDSPIHPPTLGQFVKACADLPIAKNDKGPTIQEQLCAYVSIVLHSRLAPKQFSAPWTYLYREWVDAEKPKHLQRCAECTGVVIDPDGPSSGHRIMVVDMLADTEGHSRAMRSFRPGPPAPSSRTLQLPDMTR